MSTTRSKKESILGNVQKQNCAVDPDWIRIQWGPWIRIRVCDPDPDLGGKKWPTNIKKLVNFIFWIAGCSILRAEGFSYSLDMIRIRIHLNCWIPIQLWAKHNTRNPPWTSRWPSGRAVDTVRTGSWLLVAPPTRACVAWQARPAPSGRRGGAGRRAGQHPHPPRTASSPCPSARVANKKPTPKNPPKKTQKTHLKNH